MSEFDKILTLITLFGFGLAVFMWHGARRLDELAAERRRLTEDKGLTEESSHTRI